MRRFFLFLAVSAAALFCLSCHPMDKEADYLFSYEVLALIHDETDRAALETYFNDNYLKETHTLSYHGKYADAVSKGAAFFEEGRNRIDGQFILNCIREQDEFVQLFCVMSRSNTREYINYTYWDYELKQSLTGEAQ